MALQKEVQPFLTFSIIIISLWSHHQHLGLAHIYEPFSVPWLHDYHLQLSPGISIDAAIFHACPKSTYSPLPDDYNCKVELAMTSDGKTIVCYHPSVDIPYEHTKPIPQLDPVTYKEETHDQVLKSKLDEKEVYKNEPTIETLSKMFYTTKHRWYPVGQYHTRRKKTNTPKDR